MDWSPWSAVYPKLTKQGLNELAARPIANHLPMTATHIYARVRAKQHPAECALFVRPSHLHAGSLERNVAAAQGGQVLLTSQPRLRHFSLIFQAIAVHRNACTTVERTALSWLTPCPERPYNIFDEQ